MGCPRLSFVALAVLFGSLTAHAKPTAEVLHFWTSGGEARATQFLKTEFEARGGVWDDTPVAGGGGDAMAAVLRARALAGVPPSVVQIKGQNIQDWAEVGALEDLNAIAEQQNWDALLPDLLKETVQYQGQYVAVPLNIHRVDWIWANPKVLEKVGVTPPQTWGEFNETADKLLAAGIIPLAHGGQPWQEVTLFEVVLLGIGGAEFYKKVYLDLDPEALRSDTMTKVFDQMRKLSTYVDPSAPGREWNLATAMVMRGEAAMQIMGDWAKAEFLAAGLKPGKDFICVPSPSNGGYIINSDSFAMFKVSDPEQKAGQALMASMLLDETVQKEFNLLKGSIPARMGVSLDGFDACAIKSNEDLILNSARDTVVGSIAHELVQSGAVRGAFLDVITEHFNTEMSSQDAVNKLAETVVLAD